MFLALVLPLLQLVEGSQKWSVSFVERTVIREPVLRFPKLYSI